MKNNLINQLTCSIKHPAGTSPGKALPLSQEYYQSYIYPAIEAVCEKYKNYDVCIEKLTIDMTGTSIEDLTGKIAATLEEKIIEEISVLATAKTENTGLPLQENDLWHSLIHYLKTGTLPWNYTMDSKNNIEKIIQGLFSDPIDDISERNQDFFRLLVQNPYALRRFLYLVDETVLDRLIHTAFASAGASNLCKIFEQYTVKPDSLPKKELKKMVFEAMLPSYFTANMRHGEIIARLCEQVAQKIKSPALEKTLQTSFTSTDPSSQMEHLMKVLVKHLAENKITGPAQSEIIDKPESLSTLDRESEKRIMIANAGLVIMHPLFENLFQQVGLIDEHGHFKSEASRHRAVHLLHTLTGLTGKHFEYLLPLNKIICGMDMNMPVDPAFRIKKQEREELNDLLKAVLTHWRALKSTSIRGLQESFIRRRGTIEKNDNDWIVRVENTGIDILLNDLPWSVQIMKFPWNNYIIFVEWSH